MNITLWKMVAHKRDWECSDSSFFISHKKVTSGGRIKRNEFDIIEILNKVIFDSNCFYVHDKKLESQKHIKSDEFAFLPLWPLQLRVNRMMYIKLKENFFPLWVEWVLDFPRYQRHDYEITVFSFAMSEMERKDQNEWCSSKSWG